MLEMSAASFDCRPIINFIFLTFLYYINRVNGERKVMQENFLAP